MTTRRSISRAAIAGCLATAVAGLALTTAARAAEKLIYATYITDVYSASKTDIWLMNEIEKRSGGEIKFEKYWASSLLKAPDLFPGLRSGAADVVLGAPAGYNVKEYPLANVLMPFMSTRGDAVTLAWRDLYKNNAAFRGEFESKGAKILYSVAWAENTVWSRKPIAKLSDLKGLKVRAVPTISDAIRKLGATPVALAWPDGLEGLQRGVVEAMSSAPFDSAVHGNVQDVAKHGTDLGGTGIFAVATIGMNLARYNKLSEKHRKIIDEVAAEAPVQGIRLLNESLDAAVAKLCNMKEKLTVSEFDAADKAEVQKLAATGLQEDWLKRVKAETKADGRAMLDEFLGYVRKYEKESTYVPGFARYKKKCG
ncbi:MAG: TRAP transporter substrate-binding protein DctP [Hyphomicrobiaceae bacterium]